MIHCPNCDTIHLEGTLFCQECGAALSKDLVYSEKQTDALGGRRAARSQRGAGKAAVASDIPFGSAGLAPGSFALWIVNSERYQVFEMDQEILIGRADTENQVFPDLDLTPDGGAEGGVSRRHARITFRSGVPYVEDLSSTNHTYLNNVRLEPLTPQVLHHGDELRLGTVLLHVELPQGTEVEE